MSKDEMKKNTKKNLEKVKSNIALKIIIIAVFFASVILVLHFAYNYLRDDVRDRINLIINNSNVTNSLKSDVYIENGVVYLSKSDTANFFDSSIYYDEKYDQIITSSYDKLAAMPIGKTQIEVNSSNTNI